MYVDKPIIFMMLVFMLIAWTTASYYDARNNDKYCDFTVLYVLMGLLMSLISIISSVAISILMFWLTKV